MGRPSALRPNAGARQASPSTATLRAIDIGERAMAELLIITGPPGAGKSTVAQMVVDRFEPGALVQGDVFFGFVGRGYIDPWLPESHEQNTVVTEATARATSVFARGGFTTVFDGM